jgi:NAD-dependent deacetylase
MEGIYKAAEIVSRGNGYVFTGAGISVPSGIPDFRSPDGIWARADQFMVGTYQGLKMDPQGYHRFWSPLYRKALETGPNEAHLAVCRLQELGLVSAVVTQNIDNLHLVAGSSTVLELHGNGLRSICTECGKGISTEVLLDREQYDCPDCGGIVRHDVVLFNDPLPTEILNESLRIAISSDWVLVIGSSLVVYPAASVPLTTLKMGGKLIIVDTEHTPIDDSADVVLRGNCSRIMPELVSRVESRIRKFGH